MDDNRLLVQGSIERLLCGMLAILSIGCSEPKASSNKFVGPVFSWAPDGPIATVEVRAELDGKVYMTWRFEDVDTTSRVVPADQSSGVSIFNECRVFSPRNWECESGIDRANLDSNTLTLKIGETSPMVLQRVER